MPEGQEVQELQRDEAMQPGVLGLVDHTHPATAQLCDDAVVRGYASGGPRSRLSRLSLFYRYLKFFHQYSYELFLRYAELPSS
jgi:hypothetical protein